jgi:LysR family transcriptional activator of dmlA
MNTDSELAFFCVLVKQGSLAAAARELNLTPPAVSRRLSLLEERLGVRLLNRTTRRISLTGEGEVYFENAQRILSDIDEMEQRVSSSRAAPRGLLRVNAPLGVLAVPTSGRQFRASARPIPMSRCSCT